MKKHPIKKVLIANRGEIAVRIIRTCKEMGISTVAVFSEADRSSPFVRFADEAYHIGPAPALESYLCKEKIIAVAKRFGADAIHPGYGFLSENPDFAKMVNDAGIIFIGPPSEVVRTLGNKTSAREIAKTINIPMVPGVIDPIKSTTEAKSVAKSIGYPILLKAAAGGGGKGMRIVQSEENLEGALTGAQSEAMSAFGDSRVYMEKYLENPRHIEVQILADGYGNVIHLGERECSIQRRHQKIIEESPSTALSDNLREQITSAAVSLAKAGKYLNAGTIEFLLDKDSKFYFMEMNTRLQVEHPVTEMRTGIDLVREQIRIASGEPLSFNQSSIKFRGHAIECRIYAEDPENQFFPSTGRILHLSPPSGAGVREDRGVESGSEITPHYDPMISKLVTFGEDRKDALQRAISCLKSYELAGVRNNVIFCSWILSQPNFQNGTYDTGFLDRVLPEFRNQTHYHDNHLVAALIAAYHGSDAETLPRNDASVDLTNGRSTPSRWTQKRTEHYR